MFYAHAELSGEEKWTSQTIASRLTELGLEVERNLGGLGVVGILRGRHPGPTLAYRADMDALPVEGAEGTPSGARHTCGHDAHMTIALGTAEVLAALRDHITGTIKFIFQPAEESLAGARRMIEAGVLDNPRPEAIFALHAFPIPVGSLAVTPGIALPGVDEFLIRLYSPAGALGELASRIAEALRALTTASPPADRETFCRLVHALQRDEDAGRVLLLSCWQTSPTPALPFHLLGLVSISGPGARSRIHKRIRQILRGLTSEAGAAFDLQFTMTTPPVYNDPSLLARALPLLRRAVGEENVLLLRAPYPFAHEDFARYQRIIPGLFIWLGAANPSEGIRTVLHAPDFRVDDETLTVGTRTASMLLAMWGKREAIT